MDRDPIGRLSPHTLIIINTLWGDPGVFARSIERIIAATGSKDPSLSFVPCGYNQGGSLTHLLVITKDEIPDADLFGR